MNIIKIFRIQIAVLFLLACGAAADAADKIQISTGAMGGLYDTAGQAICRAIESNATSRAVKCVTVPSSGSTSNALELDGERVQFGIVQSDVQYMAATGRGFFSTVGADSNLRSVLALHEEAFTVLVRAGDPIADFEALRGRKFSAGSLGTGTRETAEALFNVLGWSREDRAALVEIPVERQAEALCAGEVDAVGYLVGHPSVGIAAAAASCKIRFLPLPAAAVAELGRKMRYYLPVQISAGLYEEQSEPIATIGVRATLVTTDNTPDRDVYHLVASVFKNLGIIRAASPALAGLSAQMMSTQGLTAPLHPGAKSYYQAQGLPTPATSANDSEDQSAIDPGAARVPKGLVIDPEAKAGQTGGGKSSPVNKPDYNSVPVGPGQKWRLEAGEFNSKDPSLSGDKAMPAAEENIRLRIPTRPK